MLGRCRELQVARLRKHYDIVDGMRHHDKPAVSARGGLDVCRLRRQRSRCLGEHDARVRHAQHLPLAETGHHCSALKRALDERQLSHDPSGRLLASAPP